MLAPLYFDLGSLMSLCRLLPALEPAQEAAILRKETWKYEIATCAAIAALVYGEVISRTQTSPTTG